MIRVIFPLKVRAVTVQFTQRWELLFSVKGGVLIQQKFIKLDFENYIKRHSGVSIEGYTPNIY